MAEVKFDRATTIDRALNAAVAEAVHGNAQGIAGLDAPAQIKLGLKLLKIAVTVDGIDTVADAKLRDFASKMAAPAKAAFLNGLDKYEALPPGKRDLVAFTGDAEELIAFIERWVTPKPKESPTKPATKTDKLGAAKAKPVLAKELPRLSLGQASTQQQLDTVDRLFSLATAKDHFINPFEHELLVAYAELLGGSAQVIERKLEKRLSDSTAGVAAAMPHLKDIPVDLAAVLKYRAQPRAMFALQTQKDSYDRMVTALGGSVWGAIVALKKVDNRDLDPEQRKAINDGLAKFPTISYEKYKQPDEADAEVAVLPDDQPAQVQALKKKFVGE